MQRKIRLLLLSICLLIGLGSAWIHFHRIYLQVNETLTTAEDERHDWVISPDFGLIKEKLIETHRDHWVAVKKDERLARWEFGGMLAIATIAISLIFMEIYQPKKSS